MTIGRGSSAERLRLAALLRLVSAEQFVVCQPRSFSIPPTHRYPSYAELRLCQIPAAVDVHGATTGATKAKARDRGKNSASGNHVTYAVAPRLWSFLIAFWIRMPSGIENHCGEAEFFVLMNVFVTVFRRFWGFVDGDEHLPVVSNRREQYLIEERLWTFVRMGNIGGKSRNLTELRGTEFFWGLTARKSDKISQTYTREVQPGLSLLRFSPGDFGLWSKSPGSGFTWKISGL